MFEVEFDAGFGSGVQRRPLEVFVGRSVELVCPSLGNDTNNAAAVAAVLRIIGIGYHPERLHRVGWRDVCNAK